MPTSELIRPASDNVTWQGVRFEGPGSIEILKQQTTHYTGWSFPGCTFSGCRPAFRMVGRKQFSDGTLATTGTVNGSLTNCLMEDVTSDYGVEVAGWRDFVITGCTLRRVGVVGDGAAVKVLDEGSVLLTDTLIEDARNDPFDAASGHGNTIRNCQFIGFTAVGADFKQLASGYNPIPYGNTVEDTIIDAGSTGIEGIYGYHNDTLTVRRCTLLATGNPAGRAGVYIDGDGCTVEDTVGSGWEFGLIIRPGVTNFTDSGNSLEPVGDLRP